jgi:hypothetical protein
MLLASNILCSLISPPHIAIHWESGMERIRATVRYDFDRFQINLQNNAIPNTDRLYPSSASTNSICFTPTYIRND